MKKKRLVGVENKSRVLKRCSKMMLQEVLRTLQDERSRFGVIVSFWVAILGTHKTYRIQSKRRGLGATCLKKLFNFERSNKSLRRALMIHFTTSDGKYLGFFFEMRLCFCNKVARKKDMKEANIRLSRPQLRREKYRMFMDQELNFVYEG